MRSRTVPLAIALGVACAVSLVGCGADTSDPPRPSPSAASSSSAPAPTETTPSSAEPSVSPAVGTTYRRQAVTFVLPDDYMLLGDTGNGLARGADFGSSTPISFFSVSEIGGADLAGYDLDNVAEQSLTSKTATLTRAPDRQVGGQDVYVVTGSDDASALIYTVGRIADGRHVYLTFSFQDDNADNRSIIESILATVTWKS